MVGHRHHHHTWHFLLYTVFCFVNDLKGCFITFGGKDGCFKRVWETAQLVKALGSKAAGHGYNPQDPHGRRKRTHPESCPLTSTYIHVRKNRQK